VQEHVFCFFCVVFLILSILMKKRWKKKKKNPTTVFGRTVFFPIWRQSAKPGISSIFFVTMGCAHGDNISRPFQRSPYGRRIKMLWSYWSAIATMCLVCFFVFDVGKKISTTVLERKHFLRYLINPHRNLPHSLRNLRGPCGCFEIKTFLKKFYFCLSKLVRLLSYSLTIRTQKLNYKSNWSNKSAGNENPEGRCPPRSINFFKKDLPYFYISLLQYPRWWNYKVWITKRIGKLPCHLP